MPEPSTTRRATLGLAATAGLGALGISPARFDPPAEPDPATVWPWRNGGADRRRFAPSDPALEAVAVDPAWTVDLRGRVDGLRVGPDSVFVRHVPPDSDGGDAGLVALARDDGARRFRAEPSIPFASTTDELAVRTREAFGVVGGTAYVPAQVEGAGTATAITAVDAASGATRWQARAADLDAGATLVVRDGTVFFAGAGDTLRGIQSTTGLGVRAFGGLQMPTLHAGRGDGLVVSHRETRDGADQWVLSEVRVGGQRRWTIPYPSGEDDLGGFGGFGLVGAVTDDMVLLRGYVIGGPDPDEVVLSARRRTDGSEAWRQRLQSDDVVPAVVASDRYAFLTMVDRVAAIDLADGRVVWDRVPVARGSDGGLEVATPETLYVPRSDGIHRVDPATGRPTGEPLLAGRFVDSLAVVDDGAVALERVGTRDDDRWRLHRLATP